jgi:CRISPR-associated endonuclease Csn1
MKYRLGLDLGVGSIGSAVIGLDEQNNALDIVDAGVRIFEVSEGAEERRLKRTARKNVVRTRKRLELLAQKLSENGLWVNEKPEGTLHLRSKSPYKIRHDAVYGQLENPNYVGRAILHLAKHRGAGYVCASEEMEEEILDEGEKSKKKASPYENMSSYLRKTDSKTLGDFFYKRLCEGFEKDQDKNFIAPEKRILRQKAYALQNSAVDYAIPRYLVKDEFNQIWDTQAKYFLQMQKEGLKQEIYDILFYEKAPAPYATGKCIYFRQEDRLLKAHPLTEMRRLYEEVNNIRLENDLTRYRLSVEQRDKIINELLLKGHNAGKKAIKSLLKLGGQVKVSIEEDKVIKAYLYSRPEFTKIPYFQNLSETKLSELVEFLAEPKDPNDKDGRLLTEDKQILKLKVMLHFDDEKAIGELLAKLPKGRAMLGLSATKILIDEMKKAVLSPREITDRLAKTDPHFRAEEEIARASQGGSDILPYYGKILLTDTQPLPPLMKKYNQSLNADEREYGKIANPAVHMILNQLRRVVNEIIKLYGRPYEICLEVGKDVGLSTKKKKEFEKKQKQNEKSNIEARQYLSARHMRVTHDNILKYKLCKEQNNKDAYNPRVEIPQDFSGFEIEHLCPQAVEGSDTYNNLCLVSRNANLGKGKMFPYEWFEVKYKEHPEYIREILKNARDCLPPEKAWRFEPDAREIYTDTGDEDATSRYLTDTRYVSKMAMRYLKAIIDCPTGQEHTENRIISIRGRQTAELRRRWNLLGLEYDLTGLNREVPRYIALPAEVVNATTGEVFDRKKNPEWKAKPRIDHRHHAMDAITVACVDWWMIRHLSDEEKLKSAWIKPYPLKNVSHFRERVLEVLKNINVSHKPEHSKEGQLHKETGRTVLCANPEDKNALITVYSRNILQVLKTFKDLDKLLVSSAVKDEWHPEIAQSRQKQAKLKEYFELYGNTAEQILIAENEKAVAEGKKERKITEAMILTRAFAIIQEKKLWKGGSFRSYENSSSLVYIPKHNLAYEGRNNYCVDFYRKDGKVGWEVIKLFDVNQKGFVPQWKKDGGQALWSVQQRDILELDTPEEWQGYTDKPRCLAKVKKFSDGKITIDYMADARGTTKGKDEPNYMLVQSIDGRGLSYLTSHKARKVELTAFGRIKKKHKALWNGTAAAH